MSVMVIRAPGNGRGTDFGFEDRPALGENIAKLPELLRNF
jgi:hypothetical protein